jgi:hypothetical protein
MPDKVCLICWHEGKWSPIKPNQQRKHLKESHADLTGPEVSDADIDKIEEESFVTVEKFQEMLKEPKPGGDKQVGLLQETEEDKQLKSEKDKAMDLAPGDWLIWFLSRSQISLSADDKMVIRAQYKENLPDARAFEAMLQKTFGLQQSTKVSKSAWIYAYYLSEYLDYQRRKQEQTFSLPEGSVQVGKGVPGVVSYPTTSVPVVGRSPNYIYPGVGGQATDQHGRPVDQYGRLIPLTGQPRDDGEMLEEMRKLSRTVGALMQRVERIDSRGVPEDETPLAPSGGRPFVAIPRRGTSPSGPEVNPEIAKLTKLVEDLRADNAQRARREQEAEERRKQDEERQRWIAEINRGVGVQLAPILDRVEKVERALTTTPPLDLKGLTVSDILELNKDKRKYSLEDAKLELAREKFLADRADSTAFRQDVVSGIQKVGEQVGEAVARVVTQQPSGPIVTTPRGGNMVQFMCECGKPIIADKRLPVVTCLSCGAQYSMSTTPPATPPTPQTPAAEPPGAAGTGNIEVVPPSGKTPPEGSLEVEMPG